VGSEVVQSPSVPLCSHLDHDEDEALVDGDGGLRKRDSVLRAGEIHRGEPVEQLIAAGDAVGLAVAVRHPGDQVGGEELTHAVQVSCVEGLQQASCDIDVLHRPQSRPNT
jgi:hypothetical protein